MIARARARMVWPCHRKECVRVRVRRKAREMSDSENESARVRVRDGSE